MFSCLVNCQCVIVSATDSSRTIDLDHLTHANMGFTISSQENLCRNATYQKKCRENCAKKAWKMTNGLDFQSEVNPYYNLGQVLCLEWPKFYPVKSSILGQFTIGSKFHCSFKDINNFSNTNSSVPWVSKANYTKILNCSKSSPSLSPSMTMNIGKITIVISMVTYLVTYFKAL